jgi:hypothetical protein
VQRQRGSEETYQGLLDARHASIGSTTESYPLLLCSYSSRGFPRLNSLYANARGIPRRSLVSLYDLHYGSLTLNRMPNSSLATPLFFDSGFYEVKEETNSLDLDGRPMRLPWTEEAYISTAQQFVTPADVLVSFDDDQSRKNVPVKDQIERALEVYGKVGDLGFKRDMLIHPYDQSSEDLARTLARYAGGYDLVGLTEDELGPYVDAATYVFTFRKHFSALTDRYIPIHIFGCLDPRTIPYLFFGGADIFDGLAWLRYYFHENHTYHAKEMEFNLSGQTIPDGEDYKLALYRNNVEELERLRNDLTYSVSTGDPYRFSDNLDLILALQEA